MSCPACGEALPAGQDHCPACGAALGAPSEGALAPDLMRREPPSERVLEVPAFKKREPSWKDEVRERMRHRKRQRSDGAELPLFPDSDTDEVAEPSFSPSDADHAPVAIAAASEPVEEASGAEAPETEVEDLPLRPREPPIEFTEPMAAQPDPPDPPGPRLVELGEEAPAADPDAVERPAYLGERVRAAAVDGLLIAGVSAVVVYFAARAARVPLLGLLPAWPYVAGFIGFFGLVYAAFFTGLTGQTMGKMVFRLRVVDRRGSPPGHLRAALRAALGTLGTLALFGIAPAFLDPARRALHDRVLRTRVIRI